MKPLLLPTNDFVFKKIFAENPDLLASLVAAALGVPESELESLEVIDAHLRRKNIDDKDGILDIKVKTRNSVLDVEIQVRNQPSLFKREQFYLSSLYVEQIRSGAKYAALNKAIGILITAFSCFQDVFWWHRFKYYDREHDVTLPDSCEMIILELPKVGADTGLLADWLRFVKAKNEEDFMQAAVQNPLISKAVGIVKTLSEDEEMQLRAQSREKALRDAWDREDGARAEGRAEGLLEGQIEAQKAMAVRMLKAGLPHEQIVAFTELDADTIASLEASL